MHVMFVSSTPKRYTSKKCFLRSFLRLQINHNRCIYFFINTEVSILLEAPMP
jgi:hypothetical protein